MIILFINFCLFVKSTSELCTHCQTDIMMTCRSSPRNWSTVKYENIHFPNSVAVHETFLLLIKSIEHTQWKVVYLNKWGRWKFQIQILLLSHNHTEYEVQWNALFHNDVIISACGCNGCTWKRICLRWEEAQKMFLDNKSIWKPFVHIYQCIWW